MAGILNSLLSKGYFPKELPPAFTTFDFGVHANDIIAEWLSSGLFSIKSAKNFPKINKKIYRGKYSYTQIPATDPEILSTPKKIYERRNIHITHPIPQALLVKEISENWVQIQKWLSRQRFSEDKIIISRQNARAIKEINFQVHRAKINYIEASADWLLKTDITRFYPTIYTHSIAWAAYGKEVVKASLKVYEGTLADRLDLLVRSCNRNQTIGIPIGPETSRIIAEVISSRIDSDFKIALPKITSLLVDRLQDDWTVGVKTLEQAENIISIISKCYREYGLEINGNKTSVSQLISTNYKNWNSEISAFISHSKERLHGIRLREFLALCLRLQIDSPSDPVLNYALSVVEGLKIQKSDLEIVESFLLKASAISPISMDRICRIIINIEHSVGGLSKDRLTRRFVSLAERHFENGSLYEVIWLLYTIRGMKKPFLSKTIMALAENVQSSAIRLILLDMKSKGLCISLLPTSSWEKDIKAERILTDWSWLFAYEAIRKGWLSDPGGILSSKFFKPLHDRDVVFYDPTKNVKASATIKKMTSSVRRSQALEVQQLLRLLRGFDGRFDGGAMEY